MSEDEYRYRLVWQMFVPGDSEWRDYEREGEYDDLADQLVGLRQLEAEGEPVRGARMERAGKPDWQPFPEEAT